MKLSSEMNASEKRYMFSPQFPADKVSRMTMTMTSTTRKYSQESIDKKAKNLCMQNVRKRSKQSMKTCNPYFFIHCLISQLPLHSPLLAIFLENLYPSIILMSNK